MPISPIQHLVVLCHPERGSFNHQVAETYSETARELGHKVQLRDLYALRFDPVLEFAGQSLDLRILDDATEIRACDVLTLVYPIWFGLPPAMIKGYVDRVLGAGFRPTRDRLRANSPFLHGKRMLSITTSASTEAWLAEQGQLSALRDGFDAYLATIFGLARAARVHFDSIVPDLDAQYAREQLERVREATRAICADAQDAAYRKVAAEARKRPRAMLHMRARGERNDAVMS